MNILFTTPRFAPDVGGAETFLDDLTRVLAERGHQISVFTATPQEHLPRVELHGRVEVVRVPHVVPRSIRGPVSAIRFATRAFRLVATLRTLLRKRRIDVACVGLTGIELFALLICRRLRGFRLVVYLHGGELRAYTKVSVPTRWALRRALRTCDAAIAVSQALKEEAIRFEPCVRRRVVVIPNAVDVTALRGAMDHRHDGPYILFAGRLHPVKGLVTLIDAFGRIAPQIPGLDLLIAGEGPLNDSCRAQASALGLDGRIHWLGAQTRTQVASLLKGAAFAVLPSRAEGCPLFVLEAQALGRLVIGTRVKGIVEVIDDGVTGELCEPESVEALADHLYAHARDPHRRSAIEAHLRAASVADVHVIAENHLQAYRGETTALSICVVSSFYGHDRANSGLSSYYLTLCRSLAELGHHLRLLTSPENVPKETANGFLVNALPTSLAALVPQTLDRGVSGSLRRAAARIRFAWQAFRAVRHFDRVEGIDLVIAPELFAPGLFLSLLMRRKLVTRLHTPTVLGDRYNGNSRPASGQRLKTRIASWPERVQAVRSQALSAASQHLIDVISDEWRIPASRITKVPNAIWIDSSRQLAEAQPREIAGDYLLYLGRLERRKGVPALTEALGDVLPRHRSLQAVYVGSDWGLKEAILRSPAFATGRMTLFNTMDRARLLGVIRHARVVVLPSLFENVSNAMLESMALARPVIGTRATGFEELIQDGVNGFLVDRDDAVSLARTINACLERSDLEEIGMHALDRVRQYDALTVGRQHVAFLRRVLSH